MLAGGEVPLKSEVEALLRVLAKKEVPDDWGDGHFISNDRMELPAQAFVLARYCAARGQEALAAQLMKAAETHARKTGYTPADRLQMELSFVLQFRATLALANPQLDRHALARLFQNIEDRCPAICR